MNEYYIKQIGGHPVQVLLDQAISEDDAAGRSPPGRVTFPSYDLEAVYLGEHPLRPVAAMSFERLAYCRDVKVAWAYVKPEYRRNGLHTRLFNLVKAIAIRDGYLSVSRVTLVTNSAMIAAINKQGGRMIYYTYLHDLRSEPKATGALEDEFSLDFPADPS